MLDRFLQLLADATAAIPDHYFQLPVAGSEEAIYRERVYCYELYHQLRMLLDAHEDLAPYVLSGEIDKKCLEWGDRQKRPSDHPSLHT